jgi:aminoglycoside 2'-N-acetyltransferase I
MLKQKDNARTKKKYDAGEVRSGEMGIEIDVLNGKESWAVAEALFDAVWPPHVLEKLPWGGITFADADLRVMVQVEDEGVVCHVGIFRREVIWNGRKLQAGGIGGVATREDVRGRGYASIALNAAIQTLKDEGSTGFALLFCEPHLAPFYTKRGWKAFDGEIYADQPEGRVRFDAIAPYVYDIRRAPRQGVIDLCGPPW